MDGDELVCGAGRSPLADAARPAVTMLWPPGAEPGDCLIADATASAAAGDGEDPTCKPVA